ncbi:MAG TPA: hypothetical protein VM011_08800 [Gammaproteobacteria bacterium]|nr:hypothetical protein [Gammaproteobacteria bacterium]
MDAPVSRDEFLRQLDQAMFETEELIESAEYDEMDDFSPHLSAYRVLLGQLHELKARIESGEHRFADGADLPFAEWARSHVHAVPFHDLLAALNKAHRAGVA